MVRYTLKQLSYFVSTVEHGLVVGAARALNVSQPSISASLAKLESLFGVQLLVRHPARGRYDL